MILIEKNDDARCLDAGGGTAPALRKGSGVNMPRIAAQLYATTAGVLQPIADTPPQPWDTVCTDAQRVTSLSETDLGLYLVRGPDGIPRLYRVQG